jgi:hypothetical protein
VIEQVKHCSAVSWGDSFGKSRRPSTHSRRSQPPRHRCHPQIPLVRNQSWHPPEFAQQKRWRLRMGWSHHSGQTLPINQPNSSTSTRAATHSATCQNDLRTKRHYRSNDEWPRTLAPGVPVYIAYSRPKAPQTPLPNQPKPHPEEPVNDTRLRGGTRVEKDAAVARRLAAWRAVSRPKAGVESFEMGLAWGMLARRESQKQGLPQIQESLGVLKALGWERIPNVGITKQAIYGQDARTPHHLQDLSRTRPVTHKIILMFHSIRTTRHQ